MLFNDYPELFSGYRASRQKATIVYRSLSDRRALIVILMLEIVPKLIERFWGVYDSDLDVIEEMRKGKLQAFRELYVRYSDMIYRHILACVNFSFDADDIF